MTARKSIRRSSRYSIQSQMSGVLNPDSYVDSEEDNPLWFKDFEDHSVALRPSARFSSAQNDTPVLDPNSEPESTPLQKSWWKNLDDTTVSKVTPGVSRERTGVSEKSLDLSEVALLNEGVAKPRVKMGHVKRKSSQRNIFSDILASTSRNSSVRGRSSNSENRTREESSVSNTDSSVERIRQPPVKKKKKSKMLEDFRLDSGSDDGPDVFEDALEALESGNDTRPERRAHDQPGTARENRESSCPNSLNSAETLQLRPPASRSESDGVPSDISEETILIGDSHLESRASPLVSRSKKRPIFTKTGNRKSANFDELLMNVQSEDEPSIRGETEANRSKTHQGSREKRSSILASGSDISLEENSESGDSIRKQRVVFPRKKHGNQDKRISAQLSESIDNSIRSEPVIARMKAPEFVPPRDIPVSDVERRSSKRQSKRLILRSGSANKSDKERRSRNEAKDHEKSSESPSFGGEENWSVRIAGRQSGSVNKEKDRSRISTSRDVDNEQNETARTSRQVDEFVVAERVEEDEGDDPVETSSHSDLDEEEEIQPAMELPSRSHSVDKLDQIGGSGSNDQENSSGSPNAEVDQNSSTRIPIRRSDRANESQDSVQDKSSFSQSRISEKRSLIEDQNTSRRVIEKSMSPELPIPNEEEEDEDATFGNIDDFRNISASIIRPLVDQEDSTGLVRMRIRETGSPKNIGTAMPSTSTPASTSGNKTSNRKKTVSTTLRRSVLTRKPDKTVGAVEKTITAMEKENDETHMEPTETHQSRFTSTQNSRAHALGSFSFVNSIRKGPVQQSNTSVQGINPDQLSQMRTALDKVKKQELANLKHMNKMKNTKIDAYFKSTSTTNPITAGKGLKKQPTEPKPVNKAYIIDGKVYKRPKLPRPKKWVTDRLYKFLWNKMEPKYDIRTRVRSEKFVVDLSNVTATIMRRKKYENYKAELNTLLKEMAHLGIIKTRNDFHLFCQDFLPYEIRIKVIPMLLPGNVRNIPFYPEKLHTPILDSLD